MNRQWFDRILASTAMAVVLTASGSLLAMPESEPACLPPTSMQADQAPGITRSLEKLARPMERVAISGSFIRVEMTRNRLAPVKPM